MQSALQSGAAQRLTNALAQRRWRDAGMAYLFILPFLLLYLLFTFLPILQGFWISLHKWDVIGSNVRFLGLRNYQLLLQDKLFWSSLEHTAFFALLAGPGLIVVGLALALLLNRPIRGIGIYRTLFYMPNILSVTVVGLVFARVFAPAEADTAWARRVVEAYEAGVSQNLGAVALDGQMIDKPVLEQAEAVLAWSEQIAAMEAEPPA